MKAIVLWEPWASAMRFNIKKIETRSWLAWHRGDLAICSAKRPMTRDDTETWQILVQRTPHDTPEFGKVLCVVELCECVPTDIVHYAAPELDAREVALGNYEKGRWAWLTRNCRPLVEPVPVVGRQGFFNLPKDVEAAVLSRMGRPNV